MGTVVASQVLYTGHPVCGCVYSVSSTCMVSGHNDKTPIRASKLDKICCGHY